MSAIKTEGLGSAVKESSDNYKLQTLFSSSLLIADFCTVLLESFFFLIGVVPLSLSTSAYVLFYFRCCLLSAANFNFCFDGNSYLLWSSLAKTMFFDGTFPFFILRDTRPVDDFFVELAQPICLLYLNVIYLRTIFPTTYNNQSYNILVSVLEIFWNGSSLCRQSISLQQTSKTPQFFFWHFNSYNYNLARCICSYVCICW